VRWTDARGCSPLLYLVVFDERPHSAAQFASKRACPSLPEDADCKRRLLPSSLTAESRECALSNKKRCSGGFTEQQWLHFSGPAYSRIYISCTDILQRE
jgi:hypothetical protein